VVRDIFYSGLSSFPLEVHVLFFPRALLSLSLCVSRARNQILLLLLDV
jgi:hypothetical protein